MYNLLNKIDQQLEIEFSGSDYTRAEPKAFGLDQRAFGEAITDGYDYIIIKKFDDRSLQYYGGFEYVDKKYRREYGNFVIYESSDSRVYDALEFYRETIDAKEAV